VAALDALLAIAVIALVLHIAVLTASLLRSLLPQRKTPARSIAMLAASAGLAGEFVLVGALLAKPSPFWLAPGLLIAALALALTQRSQWRITDHGRLCRQAALAGAVGLSLVTLLFLR